MDIPEIAAYSLFITAGVTIAYLILITVETKKGIRFAKKPRQYTDTKVRALLNQVGKKIAFVNTLYERGVDEVEKDLVDPVAKPIVETQQRYETLKTGRREIMPIGKKGVSAHLQKIIEMRKKGKKKERQKQIRRQKKRQEREQEMEKELNTSVS